jgi:hypothetical protein
MKHLLIPCLFALSLGACDSDFFHQDRPGGSDYHGGYYGGSSRGYGDDNRGYENRAERDRDWCYRNPDARECRRY